LPGRDCWPGMLFWPQGFVQSGQWRCGRRWCISSPMLWCPGWRRVARSGRWGRLLPGAPACRRNAEGPETLNPSHHRVFLNLLRQRARGRSFCLWRRQCFDNPKALDTFRMDNKWRMSAPLASNGICNPLRLNVESTSCVRRYNMPYVAAQCMDARSPATIQCRVPGIWTRLLKTNVLSITVRSACLGWARRIHCKYKKLEYLYDDRMLPRTQPQMSTRSET
jgi:hypothetical protein